MDATQEILQYPIGRFVWPMDVTDAEVRHAVHTLETFPGKIRHAVEGREEAAMDTPYRTGGWTIRQVIHHCADSHMNAYTRFKLALTEDTPIIKPYDQSAWGELPDNRLPVSISLDLIDALHQRWTGLLNTLSSADWDRRFLHPEYEKSLTLRQVVMNYGWHCEHHLAHVLGALSRYRPG